MAGRSRSCAIRISATRRGNPLPAASAVRRAQGLSAVRSTALCKPYLPLRCGLPSKRRSHRTYVWMNSNGWKTLRIAGFTQTRRPSPPRAAPMCLSALTAPRPTEGHHSESDGLEIRRSALVHHVVSVRTALAAYLIYTSVRLTYCVLPPALDSNDRPTD